MQKSNRLLVAGSMAGVLLLGVAHLAARGKASEKIITGEAAFTSYSAEAPGVLRKITVADLPAPYATKSASNGASMIAQPPDAWPKAPAALRWSAMPKNLTA